MPVAELLLINLAAIGCMLMVLWAISVFRRDVGIIDIFWGLGFVIVAWLTYAKSENRSTEAMLLAILVSYWGVRLAAHLAWRNLGKPEDYRYAEMRERNGRYFPIISLFTVFALQGCVMWIVSLPIQVGVSRQQHIAPTIFAGIVLWTIGFIFETVGDYQLARFKSDPGNRGHVMNRGLWRFTRHPNYFGDFLVWWGFYLISVQPTTWWWTIISPLLMSVLLIRVSGVRLLENSLRSRISGYDDYIRDTNSFFPWPPKKDVPGM